MWSVPDCYLCKMQKAAIGLILTTFCITGCVTVSTVSYSQPSVNGIRSLYAAPLILEADPRVLVYIAVTNNRIVHDQENFFVFPYYEHSQSLGQWISPYYRLKINGESSAKVPPVFIIEVLIASGQNSIIFNPSRVCLDFTNQKKEKRCATAMLEPGANAPKGDPLSWYKVPEQRKPYKGVNMEPICRGAYERQNTAEAPYHDFKHLDPKQTVISTREHPICVALLFDILAPEPSESFTLDIGTLISENKELKLPSIYYSRGTYETAAGIM